MPKWTADRDLVVERDSDKVLGPEEEQTGRKLAAKGHEVDEETCRRYGLGPYAGQAPVLTPGQEPEEPKEPREAPPDEPPAEPKARGVGVKTPRSATSVRGRK